MKIEINIGSTRLLVALAVLLMPSVIGLVLGYGTTHPSSFGQGWGEVECSSLITSENIQDRSVMRQDISQSYMALQRGTVDGAASGMTSFWERKFFEVIKSAAFAEGARRRKNPIDIFELTDQRFHLKANRC